MMRGAHGPAKELQDLNWGAFDYVYGIPCKTKISNGNIKFI